MLYTGISRLRSKRCSVAQASDEDWSKEGSAKDIYVQSSITKVKCHLVSLRMYEPVTSTYAKCVDTKVSQEAYLRVLRGCTQHYLYAQLPQQLYATRR